MLARARIWRDVLEAGFSCGLHKIERLMRAQALRARPRRRALPKDDGERSASAISPNVLDRQFTADLPNRKWIADFTYVWTAEGWLYVAAVIDLFSRRVVGWSMKAEMNVQLAADAARADVFDYIEQFYNTVRRHSTIGYVSPVEFEERAALT